MITFPHIGILGRLGNQMFQYASLVGIADKYELDYTLMTKELQLYECFDIDIKICSFYNKEFDCANKLDSSLIVGENLVIVDNCFYAISGEENEKFLSTNFDSEFLNTNHDNKSILGFFQNSKYFSHVEDKLRKKFVFRKEYSDASEQYFSQMFSDTEVISLHVRRTDYINSHILNSLDMNYYEKALSFFDKSLPVLVFSDDAKWCEEQKIFQDDRFIIIKDNNAYVDMCLMSKCDYHIIANSSFSWWGSWLAESKKTISPKQWFLPYCDYFDSDGLRLPHWISI